VTAVLAKALDARTLQGLPALDDVVEVVGEQTGALARRGARESRRRPSTA